MEDVVGKKRLSSESQKLLKENSSLQEQSRHTHEFLLRSAESFKKISDDNGDTSLEKLLQWLTQGILDMTFYEENILVDEEFAESRNGRKRLQNLLDSLNKPENLIEEIYGKDKKPIEILGEEMIELTNWRRGALLYMYCCVEREKDDIKDKAHFKTCLKDGVQHLKAMLSVRSPINEEWKDVLGNDKETYELLSKGIFSDTHVLALMYAGEMCYWFSELKCSKAEFDSKQIGQTLLKKYLDIVNGPLKGKGWSSSRAAELLEHLNL